MNDRATKHAEDVVSGKVQSGRFHFLACQRHLNDLERQDTADFPYIWDAGKSENILSFAETLTIAEGIQPKPVHLFDNQCFDLGVPMGWIKKDGYRRFRRSYESMARQNGKSFKNGIRGQYLVKSGKYRYNRKNELLSHSFFNAVTVQNSFGEIKIDKQPGGKNQRIDPVDAAIDAHFCSLRNQPKKIDVNEEMKRYLELMAKK